MGPTSQEHNLFALPLWTFLWLAADGAHTRETVRAARSMLIPGTNGTSRRAAEPQARGILAKSGFKEGPR
jgi:hypothetical protein